MKTIIVRIVSWILSKLGTGKYQHSYLFHCGKQGKTFTTYSKALEYLKTAKIPTEELKREDVYTELSTQNDHYCIKFRGKYYHTYRGEYAGESSHRTSFYIDDIVSVRLFGTEVTYMNGKIIPNGIDPKKLGARLKDKYH